MSVLKFRDPDTGKWVSVGGIYSGEPIPSYVRTEVERVVKRIHSHQNQNTITFIVCSDLHYTSPDNANPHAYAAYQKEAVTSMGYAMKLIRENVHIDFAAMLGDMIWDSGETTEEALSAIRFVNSCLHDGFAGIPAFRLKGNHDNGEGSAGFTENQVFANIGIFNKDVVYDTTNRIGGYFYRDFEDLKVRVVCLNSSEGGSCLFTEAQTTWLKSALNLSGKGEGWRSIILSHHPLDWGRSGGSSPISAVNTASGIVCTFHGHIHNLKVGTINGTEITRVAIPNACYSRENQYGTTYGVDWSEATTYSKTPGTAGNTAFCVVTIDLAEKKIYADNYGAGYDRVIAYDDVVVETYSITNNLTNVVSNNSAVSTNESVPYYATLTAINGYTLIGGAVKVVMGTDDITADVYTASNGKIEIPNVTGDIVITAEAVEGQVDTSYDNLVSKATEYGSDAVYNNGLGYKNGAYVSSGSAPYEGTDPAIVATGYIPYVVTSVGVPSTIYIKGAEWAVDDHCRLYFFDEYKDAINLYLKGDVTDVTNNNCLEKCYTKEVLGDKYYKLTPIADGSNSVLVKTASVVTGAKYIRLSLKGTGENLIVTLDEPIE